MNNTKKIELLELSCENFKGLKEFSQHFGGADATITASNGVGKTTVYDSLLFLFFGKDSTGRKEFSLRPLDARNQPIKGLVLAVQATLRINGYEHTFRKEHHEKVVKKQLRGYETLCWINDVPKKISEYQVFIESIIPEDTFKMLTDLSQFNGKLHWSERRRVLLAIAGDVGTPAGFELLMKSLNGRDIDEFKKVLAEQKKRHEKERDEINPRIDEIHKGMADYVAEDTDKLQEQRKGVERTIDALDGERKKLFEAETKRQAQNDQLNKLNCQKLERETELKNDTSGTKALSVEKAALEAAYAALEQALAKLHGELGTKRAALEGAENGLAESLRTLKSIRSECEAASHAPEQDTTANLAMAHTQTCKLASAQLRILAEEELAKRVSNQQADLVAITVRGDNIKRAIDERKVAIGDIQNQVRKILKACETAQAKLREKEQEKNKRIAEIDKAIGNRVQPKPEDDGQWQDICSEIEKLKAEIGPPAAEQLEIIETNRNAAQEVLTKLNESLAQADRIVADRKRIADYEAREKELAQLIADVEKQLAEIAEYKAELSRRIESAVNGKFKYVEFKLFNELLNRELVDCCEATYNGVPYQDMSTGQKIICGVDIVNVLSEHYGVSVPLFVDHAESLTLPLEAKSQTIELYAEEGVNELRVEVAERTVSA